MTARNKKFDPDQGAYAIDDVDVHAIVIRWDAGLNSLVLDLGGLQPGIAFHWLTYAVDKCGLMVAEQFSDCVSQDELDEAGA